MTTTANGHRCIVCGGSLTKNHDSLDCISCGMEYYPTPLDKATKGKEEFVRHCWLLMQRMSQRGLTRRQQTDILHGHYGISRNYIYYNVIPEEAKADPSIFPYRVAPGSQHPPRQRITIRSPLMPGWEVVTTLIVEKTEYVEAPCSS